MFRSGRTRPAHARSSGSETLLRIQSLAGYIIGTLESRFRKRQALTRDLARCAALERETMTILAELMALTAGSRQAMF
jgi:hypothetical protein